MEPTPQILSVLPNLSIAAVAIVALVYVIRLFVTHLEKRDKEHWMEVQERETAMRALEKEVRENIMKQLGQNTHAFEKVMDYMKKK